MRWINRNHRKLDFAGMSASSLCALHCAMAPLFVGLGTLGSFTWVVGPVEDFLLVLSVLLAILSLVPGYLRHRNQRPALLAGAGFIFILAGHVILNPLAVILFVSGGISLALAHISNWKFTRVCI